MELPHKPEWASCLMETVQMDSLTCHCPLTEKDKERIRKRTPEPVEVYEKEDVHFWIGPPTSCPAFTTLVAYLKKYICQPDCCKNNESVIAMSIADAENPKIKEKLNSGEQMLEKIMKMGGNFFPNDKDRSFFGKLQFFYNTFANCCVSCRDRFEGEECWYCATRRIQAEELFHVEKYLVQHRPTKCLHGGCAFLLLRYERKLSCGAYYSMAGQKRMVFGRKSCHETLPGLQQKKQR